MATDFIGPAHRAQMSHFDVQTTPYLGIGLSPNLSSGCSPIDLGKHHSLHHHHQQQQASSEMHGLYICMDPQALDSGESLQDAINEAALNAAEHREHVSDLEKLCDGRLSPSALDQASSGASSDEFSAEYDSVKMERWTPLIDIDANCSYAAEQDDLKQHESLVHHQNDSDLGEFSDMAHHQELGDDCVGVPHSDASTMTSTGSNPSSTTTTTNGSLSMISSGSMFSDNLDNMENVYPANMLSTPYRKRSSKSYGLMGETCSPTNIVTPCSVYRSVSAPMLTTLSEIHMHHPYDTPLQSPAMMRNIAMTPPASVARSGHSHSQSQSGLRRPKLDTRLELDKAAGINPFYRPKFHSGLPTPKSPAELAAQRALEVHMYSPPPMSAVPSLASSDTSSIPSSPLSPRNGISGGYVDVIPFPKSAFRSVGRTNTQNDECIAVSLFGSSNRPRSHSYSHDDPFTHDRRRPVNRARCVSTSDVLGRNNTGYQHNEDFGASPYRPTHSRTHSSSSLLSTPTSGSASNNNNKGMTTSTSSTSLSDMENSEKQFKCHTCIKAFRRLEHLKRHLKVHTDERPYVCDVSGCNRKFSRSDNLRAHRRTHMKRGGRNIYIEGLNE